VLANLPNGKRVLVAGQKSGVVTALDPDHGGEIVWQKRVGTGGKVGGVQWGIAADQSNVNIAVSDVRLSVVAPETPGAQAFVFNPKIGILYDSKAGGGLSALKLDTGEEVCRTPHPGCGDVPGCSHAQSAAVTAISGLVFSGGLDGRLRAYSAGDGRIVWDVDTKGDYQTVKRAVAKGGSLDGGGAVVVDGTIYVGSGSGIFGGMPGNVLLGYSVGGLIRRDRLARRIRVIEVTALTRPIERSDNPQLPPPWTRSAMTGVRRLQSSAARRQRSLLHGVANGSVRPFDAVRRMGLGSHEPSDRKMRRIEQPVASRLSCNVAGLRSWDRAK
jgi:hypothetical protein